MHSRPKRRLFAAIVLITLLAAPSIWLVRQYRQVNLIRALIAAIKRYDAQEVDTLLAAGADPNARDTPVTHDAWLIILRHVLHPPQDSSQTALITAVRQFHPDFTPIKETPRIVRALLAHGADVNAPDTYGDTALTWLFESRALYSMSHQGFVEPTELPVILLSAGANIEVVGNHGETPLISACWFESADVARILLDHGANPNPKPSRVYGTPLSAAQYRHYDEVATLLKEHGAK